MTEIVETSDLAACHALRRAIFIDEQGVPEADEWDDLDAEAVHLLARDGATPVGTARLLHRGDIGKIGRVCVVKTARGTGLGAALITEGCARLEAMGCGSAKLGAQVHAIPFYEKLGFSVCGPVYDDAGIPHRDMEKAL
ncbi:MAG: GNAT family N-acetyltransferase [Paracoccaceae bacterium]|nr:GNAT family N-acetyltransferase [Paracoccaceae bacterium]